MLVLAAGVLGGTLAYLFTQTEPIENKFDYGAVPVDILEEFDGTTKSNVVIANEGNTDSFVRAGILITWKNVQGEVSSTAVRPEDYTMTLNPDGWFEKDGYYYCTSRVDAGQATPVLIVNAEKTAEAQVPEGYDLSIEILAQSVQADGEKNGRPMVETAGWPVTVDSAGRLVPGA